MRFLINENVSVLLVSTLRSADYNVLDVKEQGWFGHSDKSLVKIAQQEQRIILTHDKDFLYQRNVAVVLLRFSNQKPAKIAPLVLSFLQTPGIDKKLQTPVIVILSETTAEFHG